MVRRELEELRLIIAEKLKLHHVTVAAITGKEIHGQYITLRIEDQRYPVPIDVFQKVDIERIAKILKEAHFNAKA